MLSFTLRTSWRWKIRKRATRSRGRRFRVATRRRARLFAPRILRLNGDRAASAETRNAPPGIAGLLRNLLSQLNRWSLLLKPRRHWNSPKARVMRGASRAASAGADAAGGAVGADRPGRFPILSRPRLPPRHFSSPRRG